MVPHLISKKLNRTWADEIPTYNLAYIAIQIWKSPVFKANSLQFDQASDFFRSLSFFFLKQRVDVLSFHFIFQFFCFLNQQILIA